LAAFSLLALAALPLASAEPLQPGQWWATFELAGGQLNRTAPGFSDNSARFYLGLAGGMAVDSHLLLGIGVSGWLIQAENVKDPSTGSGISRVFAVARIYPQADSTLHYQVGGGTITGWDNSPSGSRRNGFGWEVGIGYDVMTSTRAAFTPFLRYSSGTAGNLKLSAVTLGAGFTWR
jgi:hypothetical protein